MSNRQIVSMNLVETSSISGLGFAIGLFTGILMVLGVQGLFFGTLIGGQSSVPFPFVLPSSIILLLLLFILGTVGIAVLTGLWACTATISRQIRYEDFS